MTEAHVWRTTPGDGCEYSRGGGIRLLYCYNGALIGVSVTERLARAAFEVKQNMVNCTENYVHIRGLRQLESEGPRVLCDYSRRAGNIPQAVGQC